MPSHVSPQPIGFPAGRLPLDFASCVPVTDGLLVDNIVGDPYARAVGDTEGSRDVERRVIDLCLDLVGAPRDEQRWGYVTASSSTAIQHGLFLAREAHRRGVLYTSAAAHPAVHVAARMLDLPVVVVPTVEHDVLDYAALTRAADPTRPAIVAATAGTTMCEAVDDVPGIRAALADAGVHQAWVHLDAALSGPMLAMEPRWSAAVRLGAGAADSVSWSGHKFWSTPLVCGLVLARRSDAEACGHDLPYTGTRNRTLACSRPGAPALMLWRALSQYGVPWLAQQAERARGIAEDACTRLTAAGHDAHRHDHAVTVSFPVPSPELTTRWSLATDGTRAHLIVMPGIDEAVVSAFVDELIVDDVSRRLVRTR
ncbi:MAG: pyridoxal-dependent decarboxylase [Dermatophilaceae bacterium]